MGLRTAKEYRDGLRDGRRVFYRGQRVTSVGDHPELTLAVDHSAHCFDIAQSHPELAVADGYSAFYRVPRSAEQLRARGELIETVSAGRRDHRAQGGGQRRDVRAAAHARR
ncbi:4-hydroxyphenylacetate 3-hydroxylase N-terminal domain-containing protein [Amycolatopsis sp. NPDC051373]|uniref:4-hydroxyphenylacetate 3-hydroxylase N-terminal domain-containing protein n=1 Tax=Amycolatopsis sp. NPDC051373 TaxID=3155801 RepID=UPI00345047DB